MIPLQNAMIMNGVDMTEHVLGHLCYRVGSRQDSTYMNFGSRISYTGLWETMHATLL